MISSVAAVMDARVEAPHTYVISHLLVEWADVQIHREGLERVQCRCLRGEGTRRTRWRQVPRHALITC